MDFQTYIESKRGKKPNQEIIERWQTRVLPRELQNQGERGAQQYLDDYGKSIAAPKCILLAIQAENCGFGEMAMGFWKKAFSLETGQIASGGVASTAAAIPVLQTPEINIIEDFPFEMQPGRLVTMQPVDGQKDREYYIRNPNYWGQPKRDGNKVVVFATKDQAWYQSRSLKFRGSPSPEMDRAFKMTALNLGAFILEGELVFIDCDGLEHRTGAQAATYNIDHGKAEIMPIMRYSIFSCLFIESTQLCTQKERVMMGCKIASYLNERFSDMFEDMPTATTEATKRLMASRQLAEGREGEIWFDISIPYRPGKNTDDRYVRTKYLTELQVIVTGLTPTTAQGRPFGALEVSSLEGKPLGQIGTGFTIPEMMSIKWAWDNREAPLKVEIATQGFTEGGKVFLGRYLGLAA